MEPQQPTQLPSTSPPPLPPPKHRMPLFIGILFLSLFILVGSYMVFGTKKTEVTTPPLSQPPPTVIPTVDSIANWKSYININKGFSFKYPSEYFKFQEEYPGIGIYLAPSKGEGGNGPKFLKLDDVWFSANTLSGANLKSIDEYLALPGQEIYPVDSKKTLTTIGGISGYIITYNLPVSAGNITAYAKTGIVFRNETIYTLTLSAWSQDVLRTSQGMFDQILSTFTFLDQEQQEVSNNPKNYINSKYGFSLEYSFDKQVIINDTQSSLGLCNLDKIVDIKVYSKNYQIPQIEPEFTGDFIVSIALKSNGSDESPQQWINNNCSGTWLINPNSTETIQIANIQGIKLIGEGPYNMGINRMVVFPHTSNLYFIYFWAGNYQVERDILFNQMLSTFKFIE